MTLVYAHRGASAEYPENTLAAFRRAIELGVDVLETDAHVTRDGVAVIAHDATGARTAGDRRAIRDCTLAEVQAWDAGWSHRDRTGFRAFVGRGHRVPMLEELLQEFPRARFNIDAKARAPRDVDRLVEAVRAAGAEERVCFASFSLSNLRRIRASGFRGETGLSRDEVLWLLVQPLAVLRRFPVGGQRAQIPPRMGPLRFDTPWFLEKARALGLRVDYWVINEPDDARRLVQLGADGIMTDDPARILPVVRAAD